MTEPESRQPPPPGDAPQQPSPKPVKQGGFWRFVWHHPSLSTLVLILLLVVVFVMQNMEETKIDFLFWDAIVLPKLALPMLGVPLGALGWELIRRAFR